MKKILLLVLIVGGVFFGLFLPKQAFGQNAGAAACSAQCIAEGFGTGTYNTSTGDCTCIPLSDPVDGKGGGDCTQTGCPTGQSCVVRNNQYKCVDDDPSGPLPTATPVPVATATPVPGATCPWSAPISISTLPANSSGAIEGQADVIYPNNTQMLQNIYRGSQG
ncbi:MAG: hypothetical protein AAB569_06955, partial [Patescibacteria group bacterium]